MSRKAPKRRPPTTQARRVLDPRRGPQKRTQRFSRSSRETRKFSLSDLKYPAIIIAVLGLMVFGYTWAQPRLAQRQSEASFRSCIERMMGMRKGMEDYKASSNTGYGLLDLYKQFKMNNHDELERWMTSKCSGKDSTWWSFQENMRIAPGAGTYTMTGWSKGKQRCLITMTPDNLWPTEFSQCGTPVPFPTQ